MSDTFKIPEELKGDIVGIRRQVFDFTAETTEGFAARGMTLVESSSVLAAIMIDSAWAHARQAVMEDERTPDKDKFRAVVEQILALYPD